MVVSYMCDANKKRKLSGICTKDGVMYFGWRPSNDRVLAQRRQRASFWYFSNVGPTSKHTGPRWSVNPSTSGIARQENPRVARPGIESGSPWWEASRLNAQPPRPRLLWLDYWPPNKAYCTRIFACENRAGRCRWSTGFLGDLPSLRPCIPAPLLFVKSSSNLFTRSVKLRRIYKKERRRLPGLEHETPQSLRRVSVGRGGWLSWGGGMRRASYYERSKSPGMGPGKTIYDLLTAHWLFAHTCTGERE
ncbi:hypothetical protein PR048_024885 [Dryococelus australis]|uniref:Uncharacterized protein n=1 Tax=Dryococelus australis TaxID=614101 RepID=A0ABQ9GPS8_9NEOP|nr:hypothetical protein PR048_024885 [Dryococelus australis]